MGGTRNAYKILVGKPLGNNYFEVHTGDRIIIIK
jgi:hypothetical protein